MIFSGLHLYVPGMAMSLTMGGLSSSGSFFGLDFSVSFDSQYLVVM